MSADAETQQHLANMRVAQAKIDEGDTKFYVTTANGHVVKGPFLERSEAEAELERLRQIRPGDYDDPSIDARRAWQGYASARLPWTGEFEDAVNRGEVDVS